MGEEEVPEMKNTQKRERLLKDLGNERVTELEHHFVRVMSTTPEQIERISEPPEVIETSTRARLRKELGQEKLTQIEIAGLRSIQKC